MQLSQCTLSHNTGTACACTNAALSQLQGCTFAGSDSAAFVTVTGKRSAATADDCTFLMCAGRAVEATDGGMVSITGGRMATCRLGLHMEAGASVSAKSAKFEHCNVAAYFGKEGTGALVECSVTGSLAHAIQMSGSGAQVTATKCTFSNTAGHAIACTSGATITLRKCAIAGGAADGISVAGTGASATMAAGEVSDVAGAGVCTREGATVTADTVEFAACQTALAASNQNSAMNAWTCTMKACGGAVVAVRGAQASVTTCAISGCRSQPALQAMSGAQLHVSACALEGCTEGCVSVKSGACAKLEGIETTGNGGTCLGCSDAQSSLIAKTCTVKGSHGTAVACVQAASTQLISCSITDSLLSALRSSGDGSVLEATGCTITATGSTPAAATAGGSLHLRKSTVSGSATGYGALAAGGKLVLSAGSIGNTHLSACYACANGCITCNDATLEGSATSSGVLVTSGGSFAGTDTMIQGHAQHGAVQLGASSMTLTRCRYDAAQEHRHLPCSQSVQCISVSACCDLMFGCYSSAIKQCEPCSVMDNESGAGLLVAHPCATCTLTESRFINNGQGGAIIAAGANVTASMCQFLENATGTGLLATGSGTFVKLTSSSVLGNGLSGVLVCDAAAAELQQVKATFGEGQGIEVCTTTCVGMPCMQAHASVRPVRGCCGEICSAAHRSWHHGHN
jgi:Right handed beta helix region